MQLFAFLRLKWKAFASHYTTLGEIIMYDNHTDNLRLSNRPLPRMRTIREAAQEIKAIDPHTAVTPYHIRQLALSGVLPRVKAGKKYLINFDLLLEYLQDPTAAKFAPPPAAAVDGIRRVG